MDYSNTAEEFKFAISFWTRNWLSEKGMLDDSDDVIITMKELFKAAAYDYHMSFTNEDIIDNFYNYFDEIKANLSGSNLIAYEYTRKENDRVVHIYFQFNECLIEYIDLQLEINPLLDFSKERDYLNKYCSRKLLRESNILDRI